MNTALVFKREIPQITQCRQFDIMFALERVKYYLCPEIIIPFIIITNKIGVIGHSDYF